MSLSALVNSGYGCVCVSTEFSYDPIPAWL